MAPVRWLDVFFGRGNDDDPFWLLTVRVNVLLLVACALVIAGWRVFRPRRARDGDAGAWAAPEIGMAVALTVLAGALRFWVEHNLTALGGIGYSRILLGYRGHFGTAQLYSLVYARAGRELEWAILLNRIASTLSVPLLFALCRRLAPARRAFAPIAAALLALHPLHLLFTPTDALGISTSFLALASYVCLAGAVDDASRPAPRRRLAAVAAAAGIALVTQIRFENVLLVLPAVAYAWARRGTVPFRLLAPATALLASLMAIYTVAAFGSGGFSPPAIGLGEGLLESAKVVSRDPMFDLAPFAIGAAAALLLGRGWGRWSAPLPLAALVPVIALAIVLERHDHTGDVVGLVRIYVNQLVPLIVAAAYGLALLWDAWESRPLPRIPARLLVAACVLWTAALPMRFAPHLRERHIEIAEHDLFRRAVAALPADIDRIVVPDDEILRRQSSSTIELLHKYRMIAAAAARPDVEVVGLTRFLESPGNVDCGRGNCAFFRGAPCTGGRRYWFAEPQCAAVPANLLGPALAEEDVVAGPYLDCAVYRGELRRERCDPARKRWRLGLYPLLPR